MLGAYLRGASAANVNPCSRIVLYLENMAVSERVLEPWIRGDFVLSAEAAIHELDLHILADAVDVAVPPDLKGVRGGISPSFPCRPLVSSAGWVSLNLIRLSQLDINHPAVGHPARFP